MSEPTTKTQEQIVAQQACPMVASIHWEPAEDTDQDDITWFNSFYRLPIAIRIGLASQEVVDAITQLAARYRITEYQKVGEISRIVREVFTREIKEQEIKTRAQSKIGLSEFDKDLFASDIKQVALLVQKIGKDETEGTSEQIPVIPALKKYTNLGEQRVSRDSLRLKFFDQPVVPSIKNWLEDYFSRLGTGTHTAMQRTDYLFNSENGKKLSSTEREKLSIILRSYDLNEPITIDMENQELLYATGQSKAVEELYSKPNSPEKSAAPPSPTPPLTTKIAVTSAGDPPKEKPMEVVKPKEPVKPAQMIKPPLDLSKVTLPAKKSMERNVVDLSEYI